MKLPGGEDPGGDLGAEAETSALAEAVDRMAHQLKNPLQAMTVSLEVIRMRAGKEGDPGEVARLAAVVDENIRLVDRRIRMLIALARRSPEEAATAVDLGEQVREAGAALRLDEREDGLGLQVRLPEGDEEGEDLTVRAREGGLLALILAGASCATVSAGDEGPPYLAVGASEDGAWIEVGPRSCPEEGREELVEQARRAGGDVEEGGEDGSVAGPVRFRFPRS